MPRNFPFCVLSIPWCQGFVKDRPHFCHSDDPSAVIGACFVIEIMCTYLLGGPDQTEISTAVCHAGSIPLPASLRKLSGIPLETLVGYLV